MRKPSIRLIVALSIFLLGVGSTACWLINRTAQEPRVMIPNENWVPIFFEATGAASKSINELTKEADLPSLRTVVLLNDDLEIRVWIGFGLQGVDGLVLRRSSNQWSGIHLHGMAERPPFPNSQQKLEAPKSGWETVWQRLTDAGILTLPDAASLLCDPGGKDGTSYVVEINMNRMYRTYMYHDPDYANCNEAKQMMRIGEIIDEEFGLEEFRIRH
ncbi:MAG: hypothetical protein ACRD8U_02325 [Pyrinomonadaceae bacterium]